MGWGPGYFGAAENGTAWNLENPMRRDTVTVPAFSHIVIRFLADNPGVWALHVSLVTFSTTLEPPWTGLLGRQQRREDKKRFFTNPAAPPVYSVT